MKPVAVSLGDPFGIGPEVVLSAAASLPAGLPLRLFGDYSLTRRTAEKLALPFERFENRGSASPDRARFTDVGDGTPGELSFGRIDAAAGSVALRSINAAVDAVLAGECSALVTAPIHKQAIAAAGSPFPGHTELLASRSGLHLYGEEFAMYFESPSLSVVLVSVHLALSEAIQLVTAHRVDALAKLTSREWRRLHGRVPRIAVAGLNPHAGEGGRFGREEEEIARGLSSAREEGIDVAGPFAPDTVFLSAREGRYDVVMAMYHDQGLIPIKTLDFARSVNVTFGLPYLRASVDHGTAFDIAGRGVADPAPMRYAIEWTANHAEWFAR
ncbi:MAG: 4-hydroxythreonine-4-phosphate dehydrogenase PdxA [Thermoanaerobaculia bacterium]